MPKRDGDLLLADILEAATKIRRYSELNRICGILRIYRIIQMRVVRIASERRTDDSSRHSQTGLQMPR
jgi:hypothetical protein